MSLPQRFIQRTYVIRLEYRRVVDEECEGAERRASATDEPGERCRIAEIGLDDFRPRALSLQTTSQGMRLMIGSVTMDGDRVALRGKALHDGPPDPPGPSCHQGRPHRSFSRAPAACIG